MGNRCESTDLTESIRKKAYELWQKDGCKPGRDFDYWIQAEKMVKSQNRPLKKILSRF